MSDDGRTSYIAERITQALDGWIFTPAVDAVLNAPKSRMVLMPSYGPMLPECMLLVQHPALSFCCGARTDKMCTPDSGRFLQGCWGEQDHAFLPGAEQSLHHSRPFPPRTFLQRDLFHPLAFYLKRMHTIFKCIVEIRAGVSKIMLFF